MIHSIYDFISLILELGDGAIGQLGENVQEPVARVLNFVVDNVITLDLRMEVSLALATEKNTDFAVLVIIFNKYLVQLIKHPILRIPNCNFPNLSCCKVSFSF